MMKKTEEVHGQDFAKLLGENEIIFLNSIWPLYWDNLAKLKKYSIIPAEAVTSKNMKNV